MAISNNWRDKDAQSWKENATDGGVDRRTCDITTHSKLDDVVNAIAGDTTTSIINASIVTANSEVSQALPANTKKFTFRSRKRGTIQLSYSSGQSGTTYVSIMPGNTYTDENFYSAQTIYFQSSKAGDTLEIVAHV